LQRDLEDEFGDDWELWAADIDQAVHEWGHFVEGKADERIQAYRSEVERSNSRRAAAAKGRSVSMQRVSRERLRELWDEAIQLWVYETVREYTDALMGEKSVFDVTRAYQEKKATFDPEVDSDWEQGHVHVVYLDRKKATMSDGDD